MPMLSITSPEERARTLAMLESCQAEEQIARHFHISRSSVTRLIRCARVNGTFADRPSSGRPCITTIRQDNHLLQGD